VSELYRDFVQRLLLLPSVHELHSAVVTTTGLSAGLLLATFDELIAEAESDDDVDLLTFVRNVVAEALAPARVSVVADPTEGAIELALEAETLPAAYDLLRPYRHELTREVFEEVLHAAWEQAGDVRAGTFSDAFHRALNVLAAVAVLTGDRECMAKALMHWGSHRRRQGHLAAADRRFRRAAMLADDLGDSTLAMMALAGDASIADARGDYVRAAELHGELLARAEAGGEWPAASSARRAMAAMFRTLGKTEGALAVMDTELRFLDDLDMAGLESKRAGAHNLRGLLLEDEGRYDEGEIEYERGAELARAAHDRDTEFMCLTNWAASAGKRHDHAEAIRRFLQVRRTAEASGNPIAVASADNNLGQMLLDAGRPAQALERFGAALRRKINTPDHWGEAIAMVGLGDAHRDLGELEEAEGFHTMALLPYVESGDPHLLLLVASRLARDGDPEADMADTLRSALEHAVEQGDVRLELMLAQVLGATLAVRATSTGRQGRIARAWPARGRRARAPPTSCSSAWPSLGSSCTSRAREEKPTGSSTRR